jgi:hypothetical protein
MSGLIRFFFINIDSYADTEAKLELQSTLALVDKPSYTSGHGVFECSVFMRCQLR